MDEASLKSSNEGLTTRPMEFKPQPMKPTLYIKTPNGVEVCVACNEFAVAEHWVAMDGASEKLLGRKCLWCGNRNS